MATQIWGVSGTLFVQVDSEPKPNTIEYSGFDGLRDDTVRVHDLIDKKRYWDILIADVVVKGGGALPSGNAMIDVLEYIAEQRAA